jgi:hypothetical protein
MLFRGLRFGLNELKTSNLIVTTLLLSGRVSLPNGNQYVKQFSEIFCLELAGQTITFVSLVKIWSPNDADAAALQPTKLHGKRSEPSRSTITSDESSMVTTKFRHENRAGKCTSPV